MMVLLVIKNAPVIMCEDPEVVPSITLVPVGKVVSDIVQGGVNAQAIPSYRF